MHLPRLHPSLHHGRTALLALAMALATTGCGDNAPNPPADSDVYHSSDGASDGTIAPLACTPNRDGVVTSAELTPAVGIPVRYAVGNDLAIDSLGTGSGDSLAWDWSWPTQPERTLQLSAAALATQWYADRFPLGEFVVPIDVDGLVEGVYAHDDQGLWLLGLASAEEAPSEGQTLMVYDAPVQLYRFPLAAGDSWVSVGEVRNGLFRDLPYAGRDTYRVEVDGQGELTLPDLTFSPTLRVRTQVTVQPAVGESTSQQQTSFIFECFGEVARATSAPGEPAAAFTTAAEVRRLAL